MEGSGSPEFGAAIVLFCVCLLIDFFLHGFSAAIQSVSEAELERLKAESFAGSRIEKLKASPERLIPTVWVWHMVVCLGAGAYLPGRFSAYPLCTLLVCLCLIFIFGLFLPRSLGRRYRVSWVKSLFGIVRALMTVFTPITYVLCLAGTLLSRLLGASVREDEDEVTEDEIISMVNEGHEQGVLDASEAEMIQNIMDLDEKVARDIMTHRKNIVSLNGRMNLGEAISYMVDQSNSRFPVYEENIDNIIGILHLRDAMKFHTMGSYDSWLIKDIPELLKPAAFIPETRSIDQLFKSMQARKLQMVIVVDEYGQTAGLVALEDILEEIVGNILDEYDKDEQYVRKTADGGWLMDGMTPLEQVGKLLDTDFEEEDYDTLNGYLVSLLDKIPAEGERPRVEARGYRFSILKVENNIIRQVKVIRAKPNALFDTKEKEEKE